jgi:hypothetical protein
MLKKGTDGFYQSIPPAMRTVEAGIDAEPFDHWLDRELRLIRLALSEPVQTDLIALIERHRKITR